MFFDKGKPTANRGLAASGRAFVQLVHRFGDIVLEIVLRTPRTRSGVTPNAFSALTTFFRLRPRSSRAVDVSVLSWQEQPVGTCWCLRSLFTSFGVMDGSVPSFCRTVAMNPANPTSHVCPMCTSRLERRSFSYFFRKVKLFGLVL